MQVRRTRRMAGIRSLFFLVLTVCSCTHTYSPPKEPLKNYPQTNKIPLNVELRLSDELRTAKWEEQRMGETWRIPLGEAFVQNTEVVAREVFSSVTVTNGAASPAKAGVDAVIIPRMALAEQTTGTWAWSEEILTVMLEWTLKDPQGNTIWIDTIKGEGVEDIGTALSETSHGEKRVKECLEDLFHKSFQAISSSRAIQDFAVRHSNRTERDVP